MSLRWIKRSTRLTFIVAAFWIVSTLFPHKGRRALVVYCSHDSVFAESVLQRFQDQVATKLGCDVQVKYDTEATKSLGLTEQILQSKNHPACDVFWNNELLGTAALAEAGMLEPYQGPGWKRIPNAWKDPAGRWCGFAARLRVNLHPRSIPTPVLPAGNWRAFFDRDLSRFAYAKPLYGTTFTHFCAIWLQLGEPAAKDWFTNLKTRQAHMVNGNAAVKDLVAGGACDLGWTDTDDAFEALDEGKPVAFEPLTLPKGQTIAIPNTVSIIKDTSELTAAQALVDFLLSEQGELLLAHSSSRQIPLGPVDAAALPEEVRQLQPHLANALPLSELLPIREKCLEWLKKAMEN